VHRRRSNNHESEPEPKHIPRTQTEPARDGSGRDGSGFPPRRTALAYVDPDDEALKRARDELKRGKPTTEQIVRQRNSPQQPPIPAPAPVTAKQIARQQEQNIHLELSKQLTKALTLITERKFEHAFDLCVAVAIASAGNLHDPRKLSEIANRIAHLSNLLCNENQLAMADKVVRFAIHFSNERAPSDRSPVECRLLCNAMLNISRCYCEQNDLFKAISLLKRGLKLSEENMHIYRNMSMLPIELSNCYLTLSLRAKSSQRQLSLQRLSRELFDQTLYLNVVKFREWSPHLGHLIFRRWVTLIRCELREEAQHLILVKHWVQSRKFR
jgi:tetratricopeptide (TPR) repeat protein